MASQKRIAKELTDVTSNPPAGMTISLPDDSDIHKWHVTMDGPSETPYAGGHFGLIVRLPAEYPFKGPEITFATRIYHPNVTNDSEGSICLGPLKPGNWKPVTRLKSILEAIRQLLIEPQPDDPLEPRIADQYKNDRRDFEKTARSYVAQYAKGAVKFSDATGTEETTTKRSEPEQPRRMMGQE
ncbi:ubiquitin-conjugating enzyme [Podospora australis]|uniref:E2 ubiquitin-conjugating enzyme n=1 Tax=Podospora australis TaxID=1536484 RepID=A0AAN7AJF9_9PEZI|nr:ubiquitin-conjugating enzyme [Podospora australis]